MYNRYVIKYKHPNINAWKTKKKQNTSHWKWTIGFWKGFNDFDMCSIFIGKVLHFIVFYLNYIQNPTIVQYDTLCVSLFHLPVFWYLCIPPSCVVVFRLNFVLRGWGLWMIEGKQMCAQPETQEFLSNSLHLLHTAVQCKYTQTQIHPNTSHYREIPCTGCVWRLIKCRSLLRSVLSAFVRKRALGIPFMIQSEW